MVEGLQNPLYIFIIALGAAFLLSLFYRASKGAAAAVFLLGLGLMAVIAGTGFYSQINGAETLSIVTSGIKPPFAINFQFGLYEGFFTFSVNLLGLLGGWYLLGRLQEDVRGFILFIVGIMGINGMIMTRDLFNLFVFIEITSIATFALIGLERNAKTLTAGFKYMIAGGMASSFFLLGVMFMYNQTGTLHLDDMIAKQSMLTGVTGVVALAFLLGAIIIELKPFPANGWGLDVYQAAPDGIAAFVAVGTSTGFFFALYKVMPLMGDYLMMIAGIGAVTFFFSNLMGLRQTDAKRMLGYSSIAQMGLVAMAMVLLETFKMQEMMPFIVGGLFINHFLAKAGLFWFSGIVGKSEINDWKGLTKNPFLVLIFGVLVFALAGFPPFPGFWAKWELMMVLGGQKMYFLIGALLVGSLMEAVYLLRWFGLAVQSDDSAELDTNISKVLPVAVFAGITLVIGRVMANVALGADALSIGDIWTMIPLCATMLFFIIDSFLPGQIKAIIAMAAVAAFTYYKLPEIEGYKWIFAGMFLVGSFIVMIGGLYRSESRKGYYPLLTGMVLSLGTLLLADTMLEFFLAWEIMTLTSYLLVRIGKDSLKPALSYVIFSLGGAFSILAGFAMVWGATGSKKLAALSQVGGDLAPWVFLLLAIGFLVKAGALGLHIWVPGSYAEADDDFTAIISPVVSKAGLFGLLVIGIQLGEQSIGYFDVPYWIGWLGVITAVIGALMAALQEDMKKLLAYSSMSQVGYIVSSIAVMSHLGWVTALYLSVNHFLFKALIFLAIAGVIYRTGIRQMYLLGGLIKKMPLTYISVLLGIIAASGVPPLTGFGGKWLMYTAFFEKGWYLQLGLAFAGSGFGFLYLWRLIHTIFLGQLKQKHQQIKEAPIWLLIPQIILMVIIMVFSAYPKWLITPINTAIAPFFKSSVRWEGEMLFNSIGYWNGTATMIVTGVVFVVSLILLLMGRQRVQSVKQLNIVFASERPDSPETIHVAHNVFAHVQKALGGWVKPRATNFWDGVSEWAHSLAVTFSGLYSGNGQTYAFFIVLYVMGLYFIMGA